MRARLARVILVDGLRGFGRGRGMTLAAVLIIALAFSIPALALLAAENLTVAVTAWGRPDLIRVYLVEGSGPSSARHIAALVGGRPGVVSATALDPVTIRARFAQRFPEMADLPDLLPGNPFPPEVEVVVEAEMSRDQRRALEKDLEEEVGVAAVVSDDLWTGRFLDLSRGVRRAGQAAGVVFAVFAALIVAGVSRLSLMARADEIETMSVVGAPRACVAGPFLVEGLLHAATGSGLAVAVSCGVHLAARSLAGAESPLAFLRLASLPPGSALLLIAAACAAGIAGSALSVRGALARLD